MKKAIAILLGLTLACSVLLGGCGDKGDGKITESSRTPAASAENSTNIMENASSRLAEGATNAGEALSEAGSKARDDLTRISERLSDAANNARDDLSNAVR